MTIESTNGETYEDGIDLHQYISLLWHWAWLIALAALLAGAAAYAVSLQMTPYYESSTTLLVNEAPATQATDYSSVMLSQKLTSTYAEMMTKDAVLDDVIERLGLGLSAGELKKMVSATPVRDTQLITIKVKSTDPYMSADIANAIATTFSEQIQAIQSERFTQSKATLEAQLAEIEKQIQSYDQQAAQATSAEEQERFDGKATQYRQIYSGLLQSYEAVRLSEAQSVSSMVQVETATPANSPIGPKVLQNAALAAMLGMMVAVGIIFTREALDDTIKMPEDISRKFNLPILGVINHHNGSKDVPITLREPRSPTAEAYRTLRTNVSYASVDKPLQTLMVTSAEPGDGKTTTLSNLAVAMAQNGKRVIVTDCDLRHPRTHVSFRLNNRRGLSNLFEQSLYELNGTCQKTDVDNLCVVTTGRLPPNPAEILGSKKMKAILVGLSQSAEVILVDTPPALAVTDAAVLAPAMDGVLIVVRPGKTRGRALEQTLDQMRQVGAKVIGVVLNDVTTGRSSYGYRYKYYRDYAAYQSYYGQRKTKTKSK